MPSATIATFETTTEELMESLQVDRDAAYGLLRYLRAAGIAVEVGKRPRADGKPNGPMAYRVPTTVMLDLTGII